MENSIAVAAAAKPDLPANASDLAPDAAELADLSDGTNAAKLANLADTADLGHDPRLTEPHDVRVHRKDGTVTWIEQRLTPVFADDGDDERRVGVELFRRVAEDGERGGADLVEAGIGLDLVAEDEILGVLGQQTERVRAAPRRVAPAAVRVRRHGSFPSGDYRRVLRRR